MNIQQALKTSTKKLKQKNIPSAFLDAEVLLLEALNNTPHPNPLPKGEGVKNKSWLYVHNDYELNKDEEKLFNNFISQREKQKPVAYIINRKEFYGYDFYVDENVLIPRPETELVVDEVLKILNKQKNKLSSTRFKRRRTNACSPSFETPSEKFTLIDIGTGSGCIIISILNELIKNIKNPPRRSLSAEDCDEKARDSLQSSAEILQRGENKLIKDKFIKNAFANDISKKAIEVAKINAKKYNLDQKIKFITGNLEKAISEKIFSSSGQIIITANLPYIKNDDYKTLQPNVRNYEPVIALKAGKDGLDYIKELVDLISKIQLRLNKNIYLFLEADPEQMNEITAILNKKFTDSNIKITKDLSGKERIVSAKFPVIPTGMKRR